MGTGIKKDRRAAGIAERGASGGPIQRATFMAREGILPPPEEMERYENLSPGITDRLLVTYEKQVDHRQGLEKTVITNDVIRSYIGQAVGAIVCLYTISKGFRLIEVGKDITGIASVLVPLATLIGVFITSYKSRQKERNRKQ